MRSIAIEELEDRRLLSAALSHISVRAGHFPSQVVNLGTPGILAVVRGASLPSAAADYAVDVVWGDGDSTISAFAVARVPRHPDEVRLIGAHSFVKAGTFHLRTSIKIDGQAVGAAGERVHARSATLVGRLLHATAGTPFLARLGPLPAGVDTRGLQVLNGPFDIGTNLDTPTVVTRGRRIFLGDTLTIIDTGEPTIDVFKKNGGLVLTAKVIVGPTRGLSDRTIQIRALAPKAVIAGEAFQQSPAELIGVPADIKSATAEIDWGDGSPEQVVTATNTGGVLFPDSAGHTYAQAGSFQTTVRFFDGMRPLGNTDQQVDVAQNSVGGITVNLATGTQFAGAVGTLPSGFSTAQIAIYWGDGTHSFGRAGAAAGADQFWVMGAHTYAAPGTYRIEADGYAGPEFLLPTPGMVQPGAADWSGDGVATYSTAQVSGPAVTLPPPAVQLNAPSAVDVYGDASYGPLATLTPADGKFDNRVYDVFDSGNDNGAGLSLLNPGNQVDFSNGQYVASPEFVYLDDAIGKAPAPLDGTYTATLSFVLNDHDDPAKNTVLATARIAVHAHPTTLGGVTLNLSAGVPFSGTLGTFTLDPGDTPTEASVNWGDNGPSLAALPPVTITPLGNNTYELTAGYTYRSAGSFQISTQVLYTTAAGASESSSTLLVSQAIVN